MNRVSSSAARDQFSQMLNRAVYAKDRTIVTRHNNDIAAIIPIEELHLLDRMHDALRKLQQVSPIEQELGRVRDRAATIEFSESVCEEVVLTSDSFIAALELIDNPPKPSPALRDLMVAHGD